MGVRLVAKDFAALIFHNVTIAHDKGKPVVRQGRKATSLTEWSRFTLKDGRVAEGDLRESSLHCLTIWLRRRVVRYACFRTRLSQLQNPKSFGAVLAKRFCLASPAKVGIQYLDRFFLFSHKKYPSRNPVGLFVSVPWFLRLRCSRMFGLIPSYMKHETRTSHLVPSVSCCRR